MVIDVAKMQKQLKAYKKRELNKTLSKFSKPIKTKYTLKNEKSTLTIQKPRESPYVNRFFNEEWSKMKEF